MFISVVKFTLSLSLFLFSLCTIANDKVIDISDFGAIKDTGSDSTHSLYKALQEAKKIGATKITFPKGRYDFYEERAADRLMYISNNDPGIKRITFPLSLFNNLEIDGNNSTFIFHGGLVPFILDESSHIILRNFSIDFSRAFHSEALIVGAGKGYLDLKFTDQFPYKINEAGILKFQSQLFQASGIKSKDRLKRKQISQDEYKYEYKRVLEFNFALREPEYMAQDIFTGNALRAEKLDGGDVVRIFHPNLKAKVGNILVFQAKHRDYPGVVISDSNNVELHNITIHHAGGMGVIAQRSHNITIKDSKVSPSKGRIVSTTADATHFVNCTGKIKLIDNLFESQKDDATNIHGIYAAIDKIIDDKTVEIKLQHPQQFGFDFIGSETELELVHGPSLITYGSALVAKSTRVSNEVTRIEFVKPFDSRLQKGDSVAEVRDYAHVIIKGNTIRKNRARGMLLNSRGKTLVENNYFHTSGSAILFEGDANFWFEQGGVRDVTIKNNIFENSFYSQWGQGVIAVDAGIDEQFKETSRYNKNIVIKGNTFKVFDKAPILNLFSVSHLVFENNIIEKTTGYPERKKYDSLFLINNSDNITISINNILQGFSESKSQLLSPTTTYKRAKN